MARHQLGDGPIQQEYHDQMVAIAQALDETFNGEKKGDARDVGFVLLVYAFGDASPEHRCNFISNGADRGDIVVLFKEMIARFEGQPEVKGHG